VKEGEKATMRITHICSLCSKIMTLTKYVGSPAFYECKDCWWCPTCESMFPRGRECNCPPCIHCGHRAYWACEALHGAGIAAPEWVN